MSTQLLLPVRLIPLPRQVQVEGAEWLPVSAGWRPCGGSASTPLAFLWWRRSSRPLCCYQDGSRRWLRPWVLCGLAWTFWLIGRQVRATGYALRADDLLVVSGIMFRRLVIVPYGRMQLVDVSRGPIDRYFGLATVQLHTAAATTDATVPGLPLGEAQALRDQLASLGEQRSAGI